MRKRQGTRITVKVPAAFQTREDVAAACVGPDPVWRTREGVTVRPRDMDDGHLQNVIALVLRTKKPVAPKLWAALVYEAEIRGLILAGSLSPDPPKPTPLDPIALATADKDAEIRRLREQLEREIARLRDITTAEVERRDAVRDAEVQRGLRAREAAKKAAATRRAKRAAAKPPTDTDRAVEALTAPEDDARPRWRRPRRDVEPG